MLQIGRAVFQIQTISAACKLDEGRLNVRCAFSYSIHLVGQIWVSKQLETRVGSEAARRGATPPTSSRGFLAGVTPARSDRTTAAWPLRPPGRYGQVGGAVSSRQTT
jgi:hypothetical protein